LAGPGSSTPDEGGQSEATAVSNPARALPWVLVSAVAYLLFRLAFSVQLPAVTPGWLIALATVVTAMGSIGLPIALLAALVRGVRSPLHGFLIALLGLGLWFGLAAGVRGGPVALLGALQDLGKILAAGGVGIAISGGLREPNILLPAGVFAAFADFVVVRFGTVRHALSTPKGQAVLKAVSASVPSVHPTVAPLTIGPADFLFLGIFLACAARFDLGLRRNAVALAVVLALSLLLVQVLPAVPALAPMSAAFLALNWRKFRLTRQEIVSTVVVLVLMGALFVGYFLWLFPKK
jgi:hypothetical protein